MLTIILISLLMLLSCYRFSSRLSKSKQLALISAAILMLLVATYKICFPSITDTSLVHVFNGISSNIRGRNPGTEKILVIYPRSYQKTYWQALVDKLGAAKVDEIVMEDVCQRQSVTSKILSDAIKSKGGHYDLLLLTVSPDDREEPIEIASSQFGYIVSFSRNFHPGLEDWFKRDKCVNYIIAPPSTPAADDAYASRVKFFDRSNYAAWKAAKENPETGDKAEPTDDSP
jgi:hypothetical protein